MNTPRNTAASAFIALGLLAGCTQPGFRTTNMNTAMNESITSSDHKGLADAYEQAAKAADNKAAEERRLRDHYQEHRYLYGKQSPILQEQYDGLIYHYQQLAKMDRQMAKLHREIAEGAR
ncbi:hypothetical protein [Methylomagnum sp.]